MAKDSNEALKQVLQEKMQMQIDEQIAAFNQALASIEESKRNETKSSAGDKFETGRAMMQREQDKVQSQLDQLKTTKSLLKQIPTSKKAKEGSIGAVLITDKGNFYISVSLGKIMVKDTQYYVISPEAPLARIMMGKKAGDEVEFRGRKYEVREVL